MPDLATEGRAVMLSTLAQEKRDNRERDGEHHPHSPCENIERGFSVHDSPSWHAEQRLKVPKLYARGASLFLRALTHAVLTRLTRLFRPDFPGCAAAGRLYGRKIAAPVVIRLSSSVCAFAASFSA